MSQETNHKRHFIYILGTVDIAKSPPPSEARMSFTRVLASVASFFLPVRMGCLVQFYLYGTHFQEKIASREGKYIFSLRKAI